MTVTRTYLSMRAPSGLRARRLDDPSLGIHEVDRCHPALWRALYTGVGGPYRWTDRLGWTDDEIRAYLSDPATSLFVLTERGEVAGYYELRTSPEGPVEIAYFGLMPGRLGRGLGAHLLTHATDEAWRRGATRVWLHTCSLDHPAALTNYLRRGFSIDRVETLPPL